MPSYSGKVTYKYRLKSLRSDHRGDNYYSWDDWSSVQTAIKKWFRYPSEDQLEVYSTHKGRIEIQILSIDVTESY